MQYDGSGKLVDAIADLYGLSPKSQALIAKRIKEAKDGLGITSKTKRLPDNVKLAIYQWHYDRLNSVQYVKQDDCVQDSPVQSLHNAIVQDAKQTYDDELELLLDNTVQDVKQNIPVQIDNDDTDTSVYDFKQIHFAVTITHKGKPKRTTVMLEGYLVKALQRKHELADNAAIRAWIEQAIKNAGVFFDSHAPLTKQVKRFIINSFV
jgi:hypothetical protein